ncbi:hypothetical protein DER71_1103 [Halanaerobium sp. DL-01]|nr:hypothetical protein DER71_1103 [Halanaerobium sp. DL-01]
MDWLLQIPPSMYGIVGMADYKLNENWTIGGGIGVYNGSKTKDFEGDILVNNLLAVDPVNDHNPTPNHEKYDLDGISYRFGVGYEKEITANWGFNGGIDYLYMEIDDEEEGNVYSNGFSYNLGLVYNF